MKVTGFDIRKSNEEGSKQVAYGRIIVEDMFEVECAIINGKNGLFLSFPQKKGKNNKWYPQFKFLDRSVQDQVSDQVVYYYEKNIVGLNKTPSES